MDNQCTYENDSSNTHTFRNLTFQNSTVIGMGNVTVSGELIIDGGSVDLTTSSPVKNSKGATLYKTAFTFHDGCGGKKVTDLRIDGLGSNSFDAGNITTDSNGKITLWLPAGAKVVTAKIDGKLYYAGVNEEGANTFAVGTPAAITSPDKDTTVLTNGITAMFSVTAYGTPTPTYLWECSADGG